jgi:hypothetical protein
LAFASRQEDWVSRSTGSGATTGRIASAVILAVVAIAFLVVGIIYSVEPAGSLPSWLGHETAWINNHNVPSPSYHPLRAVGSLIAGVVFAIGAWFTLRYKPPAPTTPEATAARVPERQ